MPPLAEVLRHMCAAQASLARASRVHLHKLPPSIRSFVREQSKEGRPSNVVNRLREHAASEPFHVQILDNYESEHRHEPEGQLVVKIEALVANVRVGRLQL